ncbi:MAG: hypothetical protein VB099_07945 [Candidatus Limiplasma sp.]|nr:hypothetical protein [Candidatus Limiplasma sp.]
MSRKYSPFAALSSREQQERWLEFQNTRLPYISGEVEPTQELTPEPPAPVHNQNREAPRHAPLETQPSPYPLTFQQAQHRQYDAVIKRMTEAAKQTRQFQSFPLT